MTKFVLLILMFKSTEFIKTRFHFLFFSPSSLSSVLSNPSPSFRFFGPYFAEATVIPSDVVFRKSCLCLWPSKARRYLPVTPPMIAIQRFEWSRNILGNPFSLPRSTLDSASWKVGCLVISACIPDNLKFISSISYLTANDKV